ncbi:exonuclease domain-containing protein [Mangrovimonas aestuarii]|uniref:exonuclease domain-containing protein n=1 Tax=Mangrovimonas aestuarii TaxID=3018443 RepID=UPI002377FAE7|nr:exonuclease domain-containing protein [Mangrovimonas aestuarii]
MYAILDIETTGGKYNEEGITEIAIYRYNGHEVTDQFISLINPEREIQPFVVNLTGINNKMLRSAPKFYEVAKRIVEITEECTIVAHNADFDYRILRTEFSRLGFDFNRKTLCTVELAQTLIPNQPSYSLGKLARALGIPVSDRHRANGDAMATVKLFKLLQTKDTQKQIIQNAIRLDPKYQLETKHLDIINELPSITGVYYIHKSNGEIIYIGKSKNIKRRITQHFTGKNRKAKKIQMQVATVTYEATGSELVALLKESEEIKKNKPVLNRSQKRTRYTHALYSTVDAEGYINLTIDKADGRKRPLTTFTSHLVAKNFMFKAVEDFDLCQKLSGLYPTKTNCFNYSVKSCNGACLLEEPADEYNLRVQKFIDKYSFKNKDLVIIDQGREVDEKTVILIKDGLFRGLGFFNLNYQINNTSVLESIITPMEHNKDTQHIIQAYLRKHKRIKVKELSA